ncbi:MAG: HIT family protein [Cardiobacteriaceae bacterium]|nr:HIT family protein [Cardiobacteriaceae bacterium]
MADTIFNKILSGEIPCAKIYEDDMIFAFMDAFPQSKGHSLIIPKRYAANLLEMDVESLQKIITFSQNLAQAQKKALAADGIRVVQYNGEAAGQTVFYYHMHLIPMWANQSLGMHGKGAADLVELQKTADMIAAAL